MRSIIRSITICVAASGCAPLWGVNYYQVDVIATTGQAVGGAGALTGMGNGPSINSRGMVAFGGQFATGEALVVGDRIGPLRIISFAPSATRIYGSTDQINDQNRVFAVDRLPGPNTFARSWDANNPGTFAVLGSGGATNPLFEYDAVFTLGSMNNNGDAVFGALQKGTPNTLLVSRTATGIVSERVVPSASLLRPMIADNGNFAPISYWKLGYLPSRRDNRPFFSGLRYANIAKAPNLLTSVCDP